VGELKSTVVRVVRTSAAQVDSSTQDHQAAEEGADGQASLAAA